MLPVIFFPFSVVFFTIQETWAMKRALSALVGLSLLVPAVANASVINESESGRGWINNESGANGNSPGLGYVAGNPDGIEGTPPGLFRAHFDFSIPSLGGTLTSATLSLANPDPMVLDNVSYLGGHGGSTNTFSLYSLGAYSTYSSLSPTAAFAALGGGTLYGSVSISDNGTATVTLNSAALAAITADQGGTFSLAGIDSGENTSLGYDFANTRFPDNPTTLSLNVNPSVTPEPASMTLIGTGFLAFGAFGVRRRRNAVNLNTTR
jgi:hypothetical protein